MLDLPNRLYVLVCLGDVVVRYLHPIAPLPVQPRPLAELLTASGLAPTGHRALHNVKGVVAEIPVSIPDPFQDLVLRRVIVTVLNHRPEEHLFPVRIGVVR